LQAPIEGNDIVPSGYNHQLTVGQSHLKMSGTGNSTGLSDMDMVNFDFLSSSLVLALALNWGLQGILCLQVYTYYLAFPRDRLHAKIQVYGVLIFEFLQSAVVAHDVVLALSLSLGGSEHDSLNSLNSLHTSWYTIPVAGGIIGGVGQLFFAYRIWKISSERGAPFFIAFLAFGSICAALISASAFFHAKTFTVLLGGTDGFASITAWNGIGALCDITIALSMPYFIMRHGTGLPSTHVFIVRLVLLLIETGGVTAIMAILHLCLYVSHNEPFVIPGLAMSKIYATTMLVVFNNRVKILGGRFDLEEEEEYLQEAALAAATPSRERRNSGTKVFVSNARLTFQLPAGPSKAPAISPSRSIDNFPISSSGN